MRLIPKHIVLAAAALSLASAASAAVETYDIDPVHSSVGFAVRHIFTKVPGRFTQFRGTVTVDRDNLENSKVEATIQVASIDTDSAARDKDLKGPNYFDLAGFSTITFESTSWKKTGDNRFDVAGNLTIHGVTKQVVLKVDSLGFGPGMMGKPVSGWDASVTLNRKDYGVDGPAMIGKAIGDEVAISITVEADLKK